MLNLKLNDEHTSPTIKELLTQWRRVHVSRFPVEAVSHDLRPDTVKFVDSRFPTDAWRKDRIIGYLSVSGRDAKGRLIYMVHSRLIQNDKFNPQNEDYSIKKTSDPKKVLALLKEYVKPYTAQEIAQRLNDGIHTDYDLWRDNPKYTYREMARGLDIKEIVEEVAYLHSVGVQFRSPAFHKLATEGAEQMREHERRASIKQIPVHVFIQPDDSVMLTRANGSSHVYENMSVVPECVQQQVAMLRMMDGYDYLPEIGKRSHDQRMFWVHVNPDDFSISNT